MSMQSKEKELKIGWEQFVTQGVVPEGIRPLIQESWQRVRGQIPPDRRPPITTNLISNASKDWKPLLTTSSPFMGQLETWVRDTGHLVTLTNAEGVVVYVAGDNRVRQRAENAIHLVPGADYSEDGAGTNAIGTALVTGQVVNVTGAEHFITPFHDWACTATPVWDRESGRLLGIVDVTGPRKTYLSHPSTVLIKMIGDMVGAIWYSVIDVEREWLHNQFLRYASGYAHDTLWLTDAVGEILATHGSLPTEAECHRIQDAIKSDRDIHDLLGIPCDLIPLRRTTEELSGWVVVRRQSAIEPSAAHYWKAQYDRRDLIGGHPSYLELVHQVDQVAPTSVPILLYGETGSGKERIAHAIHQASPRASRPFVAVNCGAIPSDLVGPELFGYEGGAFTGARPEGAPGKFESAQNGTIFLDEIGELPLAVQPYLLRILEMQELVRVGGSKPISLDVRIVAATHRDLQELIEARNFRADLYYRLTVVELTVPPLRERISDVGLLSRYFLREVSKTVGKSNLELTDPALQVLMAYSWPGNLRELRNVLTRCAIFAGSSLITPELLYHCCPSLAPDPVQQALEHHPSSVSAAAEELGISRSTLYRRLKKAGIR